jgi:ligand-binding sensor domain-containing protein
MKQPYHIVFLFVAILATVINTGADAQFYNFSRYSLEEGLPQSEVLTLTEDHLGYIWAGTNGGGLCRFNGKSFDVYGRKNGLHDNIIMKLFQDNNLDLWIGGPRSIYRYDGKTFNKIFTSDSTLFVNEMKFFETSGGNIWMQANLSDGKRGFFRIRNDSLENAYEIFDGALEDNSIIFITELNSNHLILSTMDSYYNLISDELTPSDILPVSDKYFYLPLLSDRNKNIWTLSFDKITNDRKLHVFRSGKKVEDIVLPEGLNENKIFNSYQDREGGVWLNIFDFGMVRYINGEWRSFSKENGLPISNVRTVLEDAEGNFWFGTLGAGLVRYSGDQFITFDTNSGLSDDIIRSIYQDSEGKYYFGGEGGGLNIFDGKKIRTVFREGDGKGGFINSMFEVKQGLLLIGSITGLYEFNGKSFTECYKKYGIESQMPVLDIEASGDTLYFATYGRGIVKSVNGKVVSRRPESGKNNTFVSTDIFIDSKKNIWLCSDKGIWLYHDSGIESINKKYNLDISYILQAAEDEHGNLWFATFTDGLLKFDGENFTSVDTDDGLTSDNIYSVICDDNGNVWAGTQNGVDRLTIDNSGNISSIDNFGRYDGFVGIENNGGANFKDREGNLWFGTIKGAIKYNPSKKRTNYLPPPVYIRNVEIGFKPVNWEELPYRNLYDSIVPWLNLPAGLSLPHDKNHISISFDGLCYTVPEKVRFRWKLDPVESDYLPATSLNKAVYSSLSPGDYTFYVKACNNSGVWNEEPAIFSFTIEPAWWQTTALKIFILIFVLAAAGIIIRARRVRERQFKQELKSLINSKSSEIQNQKSIIIGKEVKIAELDNEISELKGQIQKYRNNLQKLSELGSLALTGTTVEQLFMSSYRDIEAVMEVSVYGLGILNKAAKTVDFQNVIINRERVPYIKFPLDDIERLSVHSILNDKVILLKDIKKEYSQYVKELRPVPGDMNPNSAIYIPLKISGSVIGVLTVQSNSKNAYNNYHLNLIRVVAEYLTIVVAEQL